MSLIGMGSYGHLPRIQETSLVIYRILVIYCILVSYCIPVERLRSESHFRLVSFEIESISDLFFKWIAALPFRQRDFFFQFLLLLTKILK